MRWRDLKYVIPVALALNSSFTYENYQESRDNSGGGVNIIEFSDYEEPFGAKMPEPEIVEQTDNWRPRLYTTLAISGTLAMGGGLHTLFFEIEIEEEKREEVEVAVLLEDLTIEFEGID